MSFNQQMSLLLVGAGISLVSGVVTLVLQHFLVVRQDTIVRNRDARQKLREQLQYPQGNINAVRRLEEIRAQLDEARSVHITTEGEILREIGAEGDVVGGRPVTKLKPQRWYCFLGGTRVSLSNGEQISIEDIGPGAELLSYDPDSQCYLVDKVKQLNKYEAPQHVIINREIRTTPPHSFYANGTWVGAKDLRLGDSLITQTGQISIVMSLELKNERQTVYSIDTADHRPLFAEGVLVNSTVSKLEALPSRGR